MKSNRNFKVSLTKIQFVPPVIVAIAVFLLVGLPEKVYSPAHIGRQAIPIPTLIPLIRSITSSDSKVPATTSPASNVTAVGPSGPVEFTHTGVITTIFWVGEPADADNGYIANTASAWDGQWVQHYGGVDAPTPRNGYNPASFVPKENPFYFALPYSDIDQRGRRKSTAGSCPLAHSRPNYSWCKNVWVTIRHDDKVAYAQWEDVGPFGEDDFNYVFGSAKPGNQKGSKAGLDVSPAVKDYLGLDDVSTTDWTFVKGSAVPSGPWQSVRTTDLGDRID